MSTQDGEQPDFYCFAGGLPPSMIFKLQVDGILEILNGFQTSRAILNPAPEVCFIAILAYAEAFFKDNLAACMNVFPHLICKLRQAGHTTMVDACKVADHSTQHQSRPLLGFLVTERLRMGTPREINSVYKALLRISPFSKGDSKKYERYLAERNLLVHHGGNLTAAYVSQNKLGAGTRERAFLDSLDLAHADAVSCLHFVEGLVRKTFKATKAAMQRVASTCHDLKPVKHKTIGALDWYP